MQLIKLNLPNNITLYVFQCRESLSKYAAEYFLKIHKKSDYRFYIIPGGTTPAIFYDNLVNKIDDWSNTFLYLSDERIVNISSDLCNEKFVHKALLDKIETKEKPYLFSIFKQNIGLKKIQDFFELSVKEQLKKGPPILTILGAGLDGHTASLFPGNPQIFLPSDKMTTVAKKNDESFYRLSMSFSALMKSSELLFLISGAEKSIMLRESLKDAYRPLKYPIQYLLKKFTRKKTILCDADAGKFLIE